MTRCSSLQEVPLTERLTVRGGLGASKTWDKEVYTEDTGGCDQTYKFFDFNTSASAGVGIKILDPVYLDFVVNLQNLTSATFFQTLAIAASLTMEF